MENLLLTAIIPGPGEMTCDQLQGLLRLVTDDLLDLYRNGMVVETPRYPEGDELPNQQCTARSLAPFPN